RSSWPRTQWSIGRRRGKACGGHRRRRPFAGISCVRPTTRRREKGSAEPTTRCSWSAWAAAWPWSRAWPRTSRSRRRRISRPCGRSSGSAHDRVAHRPGIRPPPARGRAARQDHGRGARAGERQGQEPRAPGSPRPRRGHRRHGRGQRGGAVMALRIFNTLTRRKEDFVPLVPGEARMYVCGVTVYDLSHIGHARSALSFDVIRRYLAFKGLRVMFVKNFTDVDDRIIRRANEEGVEATVISERYIAEYRADMASLGIRPPDVEPKATEHVPQM